MRFSGYDGNTQKREIVFVFMKKENGEENSWKPLPELKRTGKSKFALENGCAKAEVEITEWEDMHGNGTDMQPYGGERMNEEKPTSQTTVLRNGLGTASVTVAFSGSQENGLPRYIRLLGKWENGGIAEAPVSWEVKWEDTWKEYWEVMFSYFVAETEHLLFGCPDWELMRSTFEKCVWDLVGRRAKFEASNA